MGQRGGDRGRGALLAEAKHGLEAAHGVGQLVGLVHGPQVRHGAVQQLGDDALGHALHHLALAHRQARQLAVSLAQLVAADALGARLQLVDHGHRLERVLPARKGRRLLRQQVLRLRDQPAPPRLVRRHHSLEVVHVVGLHAGQLVGARVVDVARHRDVHQHDVLEHHRLEVLLEQNRLRGPRAREGDVTLGHVLQHRVHTGHLDLVVGEG
mmetsp:Transcript_22101/g.60509  ORF Transcript_22101/g.60509 Transcript_22101/m.60509 type:complete len:211 (+) Transcript_22101:65-697(+)